MMYKILIFTVGLLTVLPTQAKEPLDSVLYSRYQRLFHEENKDSTQLFYQLSGQLQNFYKKNGQWQDYYHTRRVEVRYETDRGNYQNAIKKANDILAEMEKRPGDTQYRDIVYSTLGNVYFRRGNPQMAIYYFNEALKIVTPADSSRFIHAFAGLGHCYVISDPDKAWLLNERLKDFLPLDSAYKKVYLSHKVQICFYKNDKENFLKASKEYENYIKSTSAPKYHYGETTIGVMENAMSDKHNEVLRELSEISNEVGRMDAAIRIYESMGRYDLALKEAYRRMEMQDSFNNEQITEGQDNLQLMQTINELQQKAQKEREKWFIIAIVLLLLFIVAIVSRYYVRRRFQRELVRKNTELEIAYDELKELDRMKTTFVQHISHEMRTPLNILNGYVQVIADPKYEVSEEDRETLLKVINQNTGVITGIVDNLLEISMQNSQERYPKKDQIVIHDLCKNLMLRTEMRNNGRLELILNNTLPKEFIIQSNNDGIERILKQLLKNALKFTEKGKVELFVGESNDNESIVFAVSDTGCGIPREYHDQVFEEFYKLDSFKQGLGVGLPMSRKIAIRLGGSLVIDRNYYGGTRMVLKIPIGL